MSLAREINQKLDEISAIKAEMEEMRRDLSGDSGLTNVETGDTMTCDDAIFVAEGVLQRIYDDLNKLTNQGRNVRDLFTNTFYINDMVQDKKCSNELNQTKQQTKLDEIKPKPEINISEIRPSFSGRSAEMTKEEFLKKWQEFIKKKKGNK